MNSISIHAEMNTTSLQLTEAFPVRQPAGPLLPPPPMWLPAPRTPKVHAAEHRHLPKSATLRLTSQHSLPGERLLFGLLAVAAAGGITYGFSCLVELVRHWAAFGAGIERFLQ